MFAISSDARYVQFCEWAFSELYFYEKISCFAGDFLAFKHKSVMIFLIIIIIAVTHAAFAAE